MTKFLITLVAYFILFVAADIGVPKEYQLEIFTGKWWLRIVLFAIAGMIIEYAAKHHG